MKKRDIPAYISLPPTFFKEPTVELKDIKDRLDEGVEVLKSMDKKLNTLEEIKQLLAKMVEK